MYFRKGEAFISKPFSYLHFLSLGGLNIGEHSGGENNFYLSITDYINCLAKWSIK